MKSQVLKLCVWSLQGKLEGGKMFFVDVSHV